MDTNARDQLVRENMEAESRLLSALEEETGVKLPRLALTRTLSGSALRPKVLRFAAERLRQESNAAARLDLYAPFSWPEATAYFTKVCEWHALEEDDFCLQILEQVLLTLGRNSATELIDQFVRHAGKVRLPGLLFLVEEASRSATITEKLRDRFENRQFDLEVLSVLANQYERRYNCLVGALEPGSRFLTARQCTSLFKQQIPASEYGFRRAEFVPYYATIECAALLSNQRDNLQTIEEAIAAAGLGKLSNALIDRAVAGVVPGEAVALEFLTLSNHEVVAAVVIGEGVPPSRTGRSAPHRKRTTPGAATRPSFKLALLHAPAPQPWNLLPKRLLPSNHQIRFVRPEA